VNGPTTSPTRPLIPHALVSKTEIEPSQIAIAGSAKIRAFSD
jgi:hypothetical protein